MYDEPLHLSNENGLSLLSGKGYGAIITRDFFESINQDTVEFAQKVLPVLSDKNNLNVCLGIISMSDISLGELQEKLCFDEDVLRKALDEDLGCSSSSSGSLLPGLSDSSVWLFSSIGRGDARNGLLALPEAATMRNRKPKCRSNPASHDGRSLILRKVSFQNKKTPPW